MLSVKLGLSSMLDNLIVTPKPKEACRILFVGDVVGQMGLKMCAKWLPRLRKELSLDGICANGENSAKGGRGITAISLEALLAANVDVITTGNHVWQFPDFYPLLNTQSAVIRPANFPTEVPGKGFVVRDFNGTKVAVINLLGRVFLKEHTQCPFKAAQRLVAEIKKETSCILVDFHAEATAEKAAFGLFLDGQVSAVLGTHTHVQTADARLMPQGTAFITDLGCVAALNSCLGVESAIIIEHLQTQLPMRFKEALNPPFVLSGALIDLDIYNGRALSIQALRLLDDLADTKK
jgi:metallophosphoesterase (TIGR00282 family)